MDYLLFLQGLFFLLGGIFFLFLGRIPPLRAIVLPASLFLFFYAFYAAAEIAAFIPKDASSLKDTADFYGIAVVLALYAAGVRSLFRSLRGWRLWLLWILPPVLFLIERMFFSILPWQQLVVCVFGVPGAFFLGFGVRLASRQFQGCLRRSLVFLAYGLGGVGFYFLLTGGRLSVYGYGEERWREWEFAALGVALAFFILTALWRSYENTHGHSELDLRARQRFSLGTIILPLFLLASFLGGVFTEWLGKQEEQNLLDTLRMRSALVKDALDISSRDPLLMSADNPEYGEEVRRILDRFGGRMSESVEVFVLGYDQVKNGWYYVVGSFFPGDGSEGSPRRRVFEGWEQIDWAGVLAGRTWVGPLVLDERGWTRQILIRLNEGTDPKPMVLGMRVNNREIALAVARERLIGIVVAFCFLGLLSGAYATNRVNESAGRSIESGRRHLLMALESAGLSTWEYHPESALFSFQHPLSRFSPKLPSREIEHLEEFIEILPEPYRTLAGQKIKDLLSGSVEDFEMEIPIPTSTPNEVFWLWWKGGVSRRDGEGNPRLISGTLQSIQERVSVEEALNKSRESLRQVVSTVSEVIFETNSKGAWTFLNPAWTELTGQPVSKSLGKSMNRFLGLERNQTMRRKFAAFLAGGGEDRLQETLPVEWFDGTERSIEITANRQKPDETGACGMVGTLRDVTARRRNQRILESIVLINSGLISTRLEQEGWQYSLRLLGDATSCTEAWVARWASSRFQPQACWEHQSRPSPSLPSLLPEALHEWVEELQGGREIVLLSDELTNASRKFFEERGARSILMVPIFCGVEFWGMLCFENASATRGWGREELALLRSAAAAFGLCLARQQGEDALKEATDEARKAAEAAEAANRAKSAFLATMSHEIRTPLNAVVGMTSLLQESELTPQQQEYAETVVGASRTLLDLINDILDYSKIEAGRIDLHLEKTNLVPLCLECLELMSGTALAKGVHLAYDIPPCFPSGLLVDRIRVRQILLNLLSNGIKFTGRGYVSLTLDAVPTTPEHLRVEIRISDTGIGIPTQTLPHLFTPFIQADSSITRKYGGTGLGLAITKRLVDAMGGQIEVEKTSGEGTCFLIALELEVSDPSPWYKIAGPFPNTDLEILLALPIPSTRHLVETYLGVGGFKMRFCEAFSDFLRHLEKAPPLTAAVVDRDVLPSQGRQEQPRLVELIREKSLRVVLVADRPHEIAPDLRNTVRTSLPRLFRIPALLSALFGGPPVLPAAPESNAQEGEPKKSPETNILADVRVLVAEDNPNNQKVLRLMLRKMGCHLQMVENGLQALQAARTAPFDLVILDLQMPVMDGLTAVGKLNEHYEAKKTPRPLMMALTANAFEEDRTACLAAGFDVYLAKPVSAKQLRETIEACLKNREAKS